MIELLKEELDKLKAKEHNNNHLRELLQTLILSALSAKGYFRNIAFIGGTALRIIYRSERYSEDLDFSLVKGEVDFDQLLEDIKDYFNDWGISVEIKKSKPKIVYSALIKFSGVLQALDNKVHHQEKLTIKIDIDSKPPQGYMLENTYISQFVGFTVCQFDIASLFAGKLHAILQRSYTKGRDFYDLLWYTGKALQPNWILLNNSLEQTTGQKHNVDQEQLQAMLLDVVKKTDFEKVKIDLKGFLINKEINKCLDNELMAGLIKSYFSRINL